MGVRACNSHANERTYTIVYIDIYSHTSHTTLIHTPHQSALALRHRADTLVARWRPSSCTQTNRTQFTHPNRKNPACDIATTPTNNDTRNAPLGDAFYSHQTCDCKSVMDQAKEK